MDFDYEGAILACARGERFALKALYLKDHRWLFTVALRIVRRQELAEEVLQDAFIKVWSFASTYNPSVGDARGWVYSIVRNQALNALRNNKNSPLTPQDSSPDANLEIETELAGGIDAQEIHHCLAHLDEEKRRAILLSFVSGFNHDEVAAKMNAPLGTVKSWIRRGLMKLRECLA